MKKPYENWGYIGAKVELELLSLGTLRGWCQNTVKGCAGTGRIGQPSVPSRSCGGCGYHLLVYSMFLTVPLNHIYYAPFRRQYDNKVGGLRYFFLEELGIAGGEKKGYHGFRLLFLLGLWLERERVLLGVFVRAHLMVLPRKVLMPKLGSVRSQREPKPVTVARSLLFLLPQPVRPLCSQSCRTCVWNFSRSCI